MDLLPSVFHECFCAQMLILHNAKQAWRLFLLSPLPSSLSYLSHSSGRNLKPINCPISPCVEWRQLFNTIAGEKKIRQEPNWLLETITNGFPQAQLAYSDFLSWNFYHKKQPNETSYLGGKRRNVKQRVIVFVLEQHLTKLPVWKNNKIYCRHIFIHCCTLIDQPCSRRTLPS